MPIEPAPAPEMSTERAEKVVLLPEKSSPAPPGPTPDTAMSSADTPAFSPANDRPSSPAFETATSANRTVAAVSDTVMAEPEVFEIVVSPVTVKLPETRSSTIPAVPPSWLTKSSVTSAVTGSMWMAVPPLPEIVPPVVVKVAPVETPDTRMPSPLLSSASSRWKP